METKAEKLFIPADWKYWIAENLLLGGAPDDLKRVLARNGFPQDLASLEVDAAAAHPYLDAARSLGRRIAKRDWVLNTLRALEPQETAAIVDRREDLSADEFFNEYYRWNRPVVLTKVLQKWPALERWTPKYLRSRCGERLVEIQANRESDPRYEIDSDAHKTSMKFSNVIDLIESGRESNDYYMTANNADINGAALRELWDDIDALPQYLDPQQADGSTFFWYGPAGTVTPLHHDLTNNFMAQVRGRKLIKLISPAHLPLIYNHHHCYSRFDLDNIDYEQFPLFRQVTVHEITLHPGELFFLPVGWWHYVRGLDVTITITCTNFRVFNDFAKSYKTFAAI
ncbi:MAG: cupin-like domain-containing protein [Pirellulaceae bacterium]